MHYRIGDLDKRIEALQQQCAADAWKALCTETPKAQACAAGVPPQFRLRTFQLQSVEKLLQENGLAAQWNFTLTPYHLPMQPLDLVGNVPHPCQGGDHPDLSAGGALLEAA